MAVHDVGEEDEALQSLSIGVGQHARVGKFPAEGVGDYEDDGFGGEVVGGAGGVAGEVVEGFDGAGWGARVESAGAAGSWFGVFGGHC